MLLNSSVFVPEFVTGKLGHWSQEFTNDKLYSGALKFPCIPMSSKSPPAMHIREIRLPLLYLSLQMGILAQY